VGDSRDGYELRDAGLSHPTRIGYHGRAGWFTAGDRFENTGEVINFDITMLDFLRDEPSTEDTSILDHWLLDRILSYNKNITGWFLENSRVC